MSSLGQGHESSGDKNARSAKNNGVQSTGITEQPTVYAVIRREKSFQNKSYRVGQQAPQRTTAKSSEESIVVLPERFRGHSTPSEVKLRALSQSAKFPRESFRVE